MTPAALTRAGEALFPGLAWSQPNDLANTLGVPHKTLYNWKMGYRPMPLVAARFVQHLLVCTMSKSAGIIADSAVNAD